MPGEELKPLKVEIHTPEYLVLGTIMTLHERLKDALENCLHPFIAINKAIIIHTDVYGQREEIEVEKVMVRLSEILIAIPHEDTVIKDRSWHPLYVPKYLVPAIINLGSMVIEGHIHVRQEEDPESEMMTLPETFVAVTDVQIFHHSQNQYQTPLTAKIAIINCDHIHLIRRKRGAQDNVAR